MKKKIRLLIVCLFLVIIGLLIKAGIESIFSKVEEASQEVTELPDEEPPVEESPGQIQDAEIDTKFKIVIDPGHGGEDPGAEGASGSYEKDFNLSLSKKIVKILEQEPNMEIYMTREEDIFLSSETRDRPQYANDLNADVFISIHANTFPDPTVTGTETFYYHDHSLELAEIIHRHVAQATGFRDRGVTQESFFVLKDTNMPAALVEVGYITNPLDEQVMLTDEFQQSVAESIAAGIKEYVEYQESLDEASDDALIPSDNANQQTPPSSDA